MTAKGRLRYAPKTVRECIDREIRWERHWLNKAPPGSPEELARAAAISALQRARLALLGETLPEEEGGEHGSGG